MPWRQIPVFSIIVITTKHLERELVSLLSDERNERVRIAGEDVELSCELVTWPAAILSLRPADEDTGCP